MLDSELENLSGGVTSQEKYDTVMEGNSMS